MLLTEILCPFMGLILYISGLWGKESIICALKGSSVDLLCSAEHPTSNMNWYTAHWNEYELVQVKLSLDGKRVTHNNTQDSNFILTINDLRESDGEIYCCRETTDNPESCWSNQTMLQVADLQVKVIPTDNQTVTLMCSTSCRLTETPAAYIWYKNGDFLYQDWSPWYQEVVHSEDQVRYSCAIKGYENLRAPEVSVDSVTSACFSVTYAKGRMCSYQQKSEDEPCSITYPTKVHVQNKPAESYVTLKCATSCPLNDPQTAYMWYQGGQLLIHTESQQYEVSHFSNKRFSCAVKGHKDLLSADICATEGNCLSVNYVRRRICALQGSSVNISNQYSYPHNKKYKSKFWYKLKQSDKEVVENGADAAGRVEYHDNMKSNHIITIKELRETDSAEYVFTIQTDDAGQKQSDLGVALVVTGLNVRITPSAVVTEGQRVTLTCSTSCPLTENTNYIWYLNTQLLTPPGNQKKRLVLDPVSKYHAGNYSCAVTTHKHISSFERTLTVHAVWKLKSMEIINALRLTVALLILVPLLLFHLWLRRRKTQTSTTEFKDRD